MKGRTLMPALMHARLRWRFRNYVFCQSVVAPRNACAIPLPVVVTRFHNITV